ncbi:MAG: hypothetical protein DRH26_02170 [Deltaproteobacteria bacterium]|nr:MAG: hypothetical protein DRH26_02170 [Deltaproteobacteria bacterium]
MDQTSVIDLSDMIQTLKSAIAFPSNVSITADTSDNTKIDMAEAVFILQSLSSIRGSSTIDMDGDGYSLLSGDCDDTSISIHPWH